MRNKRIIIGLASGFFSFAGFLLSILAVAYCMGFDPNLRDNNNYTLNYAIGCVFLASFVAYVVGVSSYEATKD